MDWNLGREERLHLRTLVSSPGWKILMKKFNELEEDSREYLEAASTEEEWRRSRGFLQGIRQAKGLTDSLLTVEEGSVERWLAKEIVQAQAEAEELETYLLRDSVREARRRGPDRMAEEALAREAEM